MAKKIRGWWLVCGEESSGPFRTKEQADRAAARSDKADRRTIHSTADAPTKSGRPWRVVYAPERTLRMPEQDR